MASADLTAATQRQRQFWLVAGCFLVSGFAALLYETVWLRQFAILLGTSEQALAVVLASYMGGLAVGSLVASRVVNRIKRPLLTYGILEFGIALAALFVPIGLTIARTLQAAMFGGNPEPPDAGSFTQIGFCFATAITLILIPTALMGATLPLLARHVVSRDEDLGPKIGLLYAINTAGAVLGTMVAAFICLPNLGLGKTTWFGAFCNVLVFALVLLLVRGQRDEVESVAEVESQDASPVVSEAAPAVSRKSKKSKRKLRSQGIKQQSEPDTITAEVDLDRRYRWILLFAAISGAISFCYEIIFTRMLGHFLGGSVFAFATMLAGFLLGIALGGAVASRFASSRSRSVTGFVYAQCAAAICTLITFRLVNAMVVWSWADFGGASSTTAQVAMSIAALLPTATCVGATFPFAIRIFAKDQREAASGSARVYTWNVVGGIVGALGTGVFILPLLQYQGATAFAVLCNILIAVGVIVWMKPNVLHWAAPAVALGALVVGFPPNPDNIVRVSALSGTLTSGDIVYNHVGKGATVSVFHDAGQLRFQTNGLPESTIAPMGSGSRFSDTGNWLSALPLLARPDAKNALIIGLGGGVAASAVPPSVQSIDVLELEASVIEANELVAPMRDYDPMSDKRIRMVVNDGRNALALTNKKYDVIISQPSHPWTAGASHLYTREFNRLVADHLAPGGVFLQWMNSEFVNVELTQSMGATLLDVFPNVRLYQPDIGVFMFLASDQPIRPEANSKDRGGVLVCDIAESNRDYFRTMGVVTPTHIFGLLGVDQAGLETMCRDADLITDERNLLAMRAPGLWKDFNRDVLHQHIAAHSPVARGYEDALQVCPTFDPVDFARCKVRCSQSGYLKDHLSGIVPDAKQRALIDTISIRATKTSDDWRNFIDQQLAKDGTNGDLAFVKLSNAALGKGAAIDDAQEKDLNALFSDRQQLVLRLVKDMMVNDLESQRKHDGDLAAVPFDSAEYELSVSLRLPWRLETHTPQAGDEVVQIIDAAAPFTNAGGLAWFRVVGAMNAGRPMIALATANSLILAIEDTANNPGVPIDPSAFSNLMRVRQHLGDPAPFTPVARLHQQTVSRIDRLLQNAGI